MRKAILLVLMLVLLSSLAPLATPGFAQTVVSVSPSSGSVVSPTVINVSGAGFVNGSTVVLIGAGGSTTTLTTTFGTATALTATVPVGLVIGPYGVRVDNPSQPTGTVLSAGFTVTGLGSVLYVPVALKNASGDDSGIQVQNTSGTAATVHLIYYGQNGNAVAADGPQSVPAGGSWTFYQPGDPNLPGGFDGSAVVHSTQPIAAIVNRVNYIGALAYAGSLTVPTSSGTQLTVPLVYGGLNGYSTTVSIQNTGATAATYLLSLQANTSTSPTTTLSVTIPALAVRRVRIGIDVAVPPTFIGTATIGSSTTAIAVAETRNPSTNILLGYAGFTTGANVTNAPLLFKNYNGWVSGAQVANLSGSTITVNASLRNRDTGATLALPSVTLSANQGYFYDLAAHSIVTDGFVGSGVFTANGPVSVTVQEINASRSTGMAYSGFGAGTANISLPLIFKGSNGWDTGVQVQNVGGAQAALVITYYLANNVTVTDNDVVDPGNSVTFYQPATTSLPSGLVASATVASNGPPIVALVNEVNYARGADAAMAYEGINY